MSSMIRAFLLCLLALLPVAAHASDDGRFVTIDAAPTTRIAPPRVTIWLPPGYDDAKRRYGVVYMHDGQNIFGGKGAAFGKGWHADQAALGLIRAGKTPPFIIVGIDQPGRDRHRLYLPRSIYDRLGPDARKGVGVMLSGPVISDAYLDFIVSDLKPSIDRQFRTRRDRHHTAIVGSSMGGLISLYAITRHPKTFGVAGAVSPHLPLASPIWSEPIARDIKAAWTAFAQDEMGAPRGRRIWFDHGTLTLDAHYAPYQEQLNATLTARGWRPGRDFVSTVYPGTAHEEGAWAARLPQVFGWLLYDWK
jgi:predicted alpha/beta superfamily hydrolase